MCGWQHACDESCHSETYVVTPGLCNVELSQIDYEANQ